MYEIIVTKGYSTKTILLLQGHSKNYKLSIYILVTTMYMNSYSSFFFVQTEESTSSQKYAEDDKGKVQAILGHYKITN